LIGNGHHFFAQIASDGRGEFLVTQETDDNLGRVSGVEGSVYQNGQFGAPMQVFSIAPIGLPELAMSSSGAAVVSGGDYGGDDGYVTASYRSPDGSFEPAPRLSSALGEGIPFSFPLIDATGTAIVTWYDEAARAVMGAVATASP
jgi:hypothetical protein